MPTRAGVPFPTLCKIAHLPVPVAEYKFLETRRFKFDFAWPRLKVALEVNGGVWTQGRHTRGAGYLRDLEKLNEAQIAGWLVLQVIPSELSSVGTYDWIRRALEART